MISMPSRQQESWVPETVEDWGRSLVGRGPERRGPSTALLIAGAAVIGLGVLTWIYLGSDLKRYLKIRCM